MQTLVLISVGIAAYFGLVLSIGKLLSSDWHPDGGQGLVPRVVRLVKAVTVFDIPVRVRRGDSDVVEQ